MLVRHYKLSLHNFLLSSCRMSVSTFQILVWTTFPYKERFRRCFVSERKRQWEVREALKTMNQKLAFVTSDNPAAAGRFMELYMEYRQMSFQERNGQCNYVNFARRMRLPALHFQLDDHIPTMASYQTSTISLGVQPPPMAVSPTTSSLELRLSDCLRKVN